MGTFFGRCCFKKKEGGEEAGEGANEGSAAAAAAANGEGAARDGAGSAARGCRRGRDDSADAIITAALQDEDLVGLILQYAIQTPQDYNPRPNFPWDLLRPATAPFRSNLWPCHL